MIVHRPSWLTESYPSWCSGDHEGQDHPADRYCHSPQALVPVIVPVRGSGAADSTSLAERGVEPMEFAVTALQKVGAAAQVWVAVVGERQFLEVTLESAVRIHATLGELLNQLE